MKALFGLLQIGLLAVGLIALFNARWLVVVACWVGASLIGFVGMRLVRRVDGISEGGRDFVGVLEQGMAALELGDYSAANGYVGGAVRYFKLGGDKHFLGFALTLQTVTLAAVGKNEAALEAVAEARNHMADLSGLHPQFPESVQGLLQAVSIVESGILRGNSPDQTVREFLDFDKSGQF